MAISIHDLACNKIATYDRLPKNKVIASHIMHDLEADPDTDYKEIVEQLMHLAVQRAVSSTRTPMQPLADDIRAQKNSATTTSYQPSPWVKRAQSARSAVLGEIYTDAHGERKRLALFTAEDLEVLVTRLATKRDNIEAQRVRFDALLNTVKATGAACVDDLSDDELADAIDR